MLNQNMLPILLIKSNNIKLTLIKRILNFIAMKILISIKDMWIEIWKKCSKNNNHKNIKDN